MRAYLFSWLLCSLPLAAAAQALPGYTSLHEDGYQGKIKRIGLAVLQLNRLDSLPSDSILRENAMPEYYKYYKERGLLLKIESYRQGDTTETVYVYSGADQLKSVMKRGRQGNVLKKDSFLYDPAGNRVIQQTSVPENTKAPATVKKIYTLDAQGRTIQLDHINQVDRVVFSSQLSYDDRSNLMQIEDYESSRSQGRSVQTYDSTGQKISVLAMDDTGRVRFQTVFRQLDPDTREMRCSDAEGNLMEWQKTVSKRDKMGNTVQEYVYDLLGNTTMIYFYHLVYAP